MPSAAEPPTKAVVLLSGGLDSSTVAVLAAEQFGPKNVYALTLFYGQKHARELEAARDVASALGINHHIESLPNIFAGGGSTLTDANKPNPETTYEELRNAQGPSPTYVPFRNGNLLSVATAMALVRGASVVFYGAHAEDARNWAYPDCTPEFNGAMANAIYIGTYMKVRLITPLQWMMKADIVQLAAEHDVPAHLTWSCYNGGEVSCGKCPTCVERIAAFKQAGYIDPLKYAADAVEAHDWLGCLTWGAKRATNAWR